MTKGVAPQNYVAALGALFNGTLEKEQYEPFHKAIEVVFDYVNRKHGGRCTAVEVFDNAQRAEMIQALFDKYRKGSDLYTLCFRDRFMQQITTHDDANKVNLKFIYKTIVPGELKVFPNKEELKETPEVLLWLREFDATVMDPVVVSTQKEIFEKLPTDYQQVLSEDRGRLGGHLLKAATNKWIDKDKIFQIIHAIRDESWENSINSKANFLFDEQQIVPFFTQQYRELIDLVNFYAKDEVQKLEFRELVTRSLVLGLTQFSKDPIMNHTQSKAISEAKVKQLREKGEQSFHYIEWYNLAEEWEKTNNIEEALTWYKKAADVGYDPAISALKRISSRSQSNV